MKRLLTSLFAGVIVFGLVAAFAATLSVTSDGLGANQVTVGTCDADGVSLSYGTTFGTSEYVVSTVTVGDLADGSCTSVSVRLTDGTNTVTVSGAVAADTLVLDPADTVSAQNLAPVDIVATG